MEPITTFISDNFELSVGVGLALYELIARKSPTKRTYSIITLIANIIKDKKKGGGLHK